MMAAALIADARAENSQDTLTYSQALADMNVALRDAGITTMRIDRAEISLFRRGLAGRDHAHRQQPRAPDREPVRRARSALPRAFFDAIAPPNGSSFILGATFTFIFVDDAGNPTDIDRNGGSDVAFREIDYNRRFGWSEGPSRPNGVDIESAAHEAGHAFGLGHFGKVFQDQTAA